MKSTRFGLSDHDLQLIRHTLAQTPEISSAIIFGSRALGTYKPGSDIDIALCGELTHSIVTQVKDHLAEELPLPYFFDVIDYAAIEYDDLRAHIDTHGIEFYAKS